MSEPQWLTAEERRAWLALWAVFFKLPGMLDSELNRLAKITVFDYHVLAILSEQPDRRLSMSDLAAKTSSSLSRLSHVVKKLEGREWVARCTSTVDARVTVASLTDEGYRAVQDLAPPHVASARRLMFDQLDDDDVADLARVGRKIIAGLDANHWIFRDEGVRE
ncbi:MarR family transcriptional regulator [Zhihengliuella sp.]|uniref:MarR family winged helix-turn-helix transcriptional regulator n=1 Tax=Zhihengliuella sp. TaxID=1954483 RepID=UPI00281162E7|nr:MarR family transcriptional regulator [Zhihengliuella sp.]